MVTLRDAHAARRIVVRIRRLADGNPSFATITKVLHVLGLQLAVRPLSA